MIARFGTLLLVLGLPMAAQPSWLPPRVADGMATQLAGRMRELVPGEPDDARLLAGARQVVAAMAKELDRWGVEGVVERAPSFAGVPLPAADNRYLDAMARYQLCNAVLFVQSEDPAFRDDRNTRTTSVFGLSAVTMAIVRLREPFVAADGDPGAIEAHLTSPAFESVVAALQTEPKIRSAVEAGCQPVTVALLENPLSGLDRDGP
jgi:hypothetical protein